MAAGATSFFGGAMNKVKAVGTHAFGKNANSIWGNALKTGLKSAGVGAVLGGAYGAVDSNTSVFGGAFRGAMTGGILGTAGKGIYKSGRAANAWGRPKILDMF